MRIIDVSWKRDFKRRWILNGERGGMRWAGYIDNRDLVTPVRQGRVGSGRLSGLNVHAEAYTTDTGAVEWIQASRVSRN